MANEWIVVVDDDEISRNNANGLLCEQQMRVSMASSGSELLSLLEESAPDLILLDILMPGMDGFETYQILRELEQRKGRKQTPVIFLTGENDSQAEQRGLTIGASDFIRKPFNRQILLQRIRKAIRDAKTIENLTEEATLDRLTGFLNKTATVAKMTEVCEIETGAMAVLDLDSFKLVNDLYGHEMGDRVLRAFADIARRNTRAQDVLCRIGGDEFLAFFRNVTGTGVVTALTKRLNEQLVAECHRLMGESFNIPIGVSAGIVFVPTHGTDYPVLFQLADRALYQVKQNGKHSCAVYDPAAGEPEAGEVDPRRELAHITKVVEERNASDEALRPGQDGFTWIYRFLKRSGVDAVKLLFVLGAQADGATMSDASEHFGDLLCAMLERDDVVLKSRPNQYFVLLPGRSEQDAQSAVSSVLEEWEHAEGNAAGISIEYVMEPLRSERKAAEAEDDAALRGIDGLSYDEGIQNCGSADAYRKLLDIFYHSIPAKSGEIESFWRGGDLTAYTIAVHALKSSARVVGAPTLSELAKELEAAGKAEDTACIDGRTPELLALYRSYTEKLAPVFRDAGADDRPPVDPGTMAATYDSLAECAGTMDYDVAEMLLESLKDYRLEPEDAKRVEEITHALTELDWERVAALCKR